MSPWISGPSPCCSEVLPEIHFGLVCGMHGNRLNFVIVQITRINNPFIVVAEVLRSGSRRNAPGGSRGSSLPGSPVYAGKQLRAPDPMRVNVSGVGFIAAALLGERHHSRLKRAGT
jgi:hypothetical protein